MRLALIEIATSAIVQIIGDGAPRVVLPNNGDEVSPPTLGWEGGGELWQMEGGEWETGPALYRLVEVVDAVIPAGKKKVGDSTYAFSAGAVVETIQTTDIPVIVPLVPKRVIIDRLYAAGKLDAARAALDGADLYTRERWNSRDAILANDLTANALLQSIGADPAVILAAE